MSRTALRLLVREMPKAELHVHLDGALRVSTALALARSRSIDAPVTFEEMTDALTAPDEPGTEAQLLTRFELPVGLLQDAPALRQVTRELVEAKAADRVRYLEIRWAPWLHTRGGMTIEQVIDAVCEGAEDGSAALGTVVRLVLVAVRSHTGVDNVRLARSGARFVDRGVTGFDLAGSEADDPDPTVHAAAFDAAREAGLRITVHAGDLPDSAALVWRALELEPERIAHGVAAATDPALCATLRDRGIALDLCPTSNVQSGTVPTMAGHPVAALHRAGVPVTISTDDPTISAVTLSEEFDTAIGIIGLTPPELWAINLGTLRHAFAEPEAIERLEREFGAWAADVPDLKASGPPTA